MPEKNVREMSALERRHYSLEARSFRTTVLGAALLGLVALVIGLGLYTYALVGQYVGESFGLARSTAMVVRSVMDVESMTRTVMDTYHSLSEEERAQTGTDGYRLSFFMPASNVFVSSGKDTSAITSTGLSSAKLSSISAAVLF